MSAIEQLWKNTNPVYVFEYRFLDQPLAGFDRQEEQLAQVYQLFAALAIFLSCLGLFGLVLLLTVQKI